MADKTTKDPRYIRELSERRAKDPEQYDKQMEMYRAAKQKEKEDEDYSALDTLKEVGKKAFGMKKGGKVKKMAKGGSASSRADGCAQRGKTKGRMI